MGNNSLFMRYFLLDNRNTALLNCRGSKSALINWGKEARDKATLNLQIEFTV